MKWATEEIDETGRQAYNFGFCHQNLALTMLQKEFVSFDASSPHLNHARFEEQQLGASENG